MTGYSIVNLSRMLGALEEERVKEILSSYRCGLNRDVEYFLKHTAIDFSKQCIAATYLVFTSYKESPVLVGYFTLADKTLVIPHETLTKGLQRRISKFAQRSYGSKDFTITAPLIAQLGKNFANDYNKLITGDELLKMACERVFDIQIQLSGKVTYVECVDEEKLVEFYESNGFYAIGKRYLKKCEKLGDGIEYYVQLIKYLKKTDFDDN